MTRTDEKFYFFDEFRFDTQSLVLFKGEQRIDVTPKALELLRSLIEDAGEVVSKDQLMKAVWADSFVEEANLSHHIFKLRKALGENDERKLIETVPKRGYRFIGDVQVPTTGNEPNDVPTTKRFKWVVPALAAIMVLIVAGLWLLYPRQRVDVSPVTIAEIKSIAVMPFINESGDESVDYLADGMTETLISSLSQIPSIGVKPRSAVKRFEGIEVAASEAGTQLHVQAVLFGRITQRADNITLYLSLIDPVSEYQIWGKRYDRKLADLSALQSEIGRDVAESLESKLSVGVTTIRKKYSDNAEAYRLYLLGDFHWAKFSEQNFWRAKEYYEKAIAIDANYALAYAGLSNTYSVLGVNGHIPVDEARTKSGAAARRAVEIDNRLAEGYVSLGAYKMFFEWDLEAAETELRNAAELDPKYAVPHELQAYTLRSRRRFDEAIAEALRSVELDPTHLLMNADLGTTYRFAGNPAEAIRVNRRVMDMDPNFADVYFEDALAHSQLGDHQNAIKQAKKAVELDGESVKLFAGLGIIHARAGNASDARQIISVLNDKARSRYVSPLDIALIYAALGERDNAFEWLEKAYAARSCWLFELDIDPVFDPIRDDPRFSDLIKRVGLRK